MSDIISFLRSKQNFLFIGLLWILLWVIPWGKLPTVQENLYLAFVTDMLRLGIAIGMFIIPGALLYILLRGDADHIHDSVGIIPIGFALSVFIIAVVGLLGRVAGFPFSLVRNIFALIGMVELILVMFFKPNFALSEKHILKSVSSMLKNPPLVLALLMATLFTFHDHLFFIDDTTYSAYLTNWRYSEHLDFKNIIHEANVVEHARFWLAMYPMGQALLSSLSGVPGLLLMGNYLELFLVPMAVLTSYWFARMLGLSRRSAGFAVLIQISLYTWMVGDQWPIGTWFYESLAEDKVSAVFLLAPVFFAMILRFVHSPTRSNLVLVILSGLGITLTHPIMLFLSCAVGAGLALFSWISRNSSWRGLMGLVIICVGLMLPYAAIQLSDRAISGAYTGQQASITFQIERYTNIVSDVFYGLNPGVLKFFDIPAESNLHFAFQFIRVVPIFLAAIAGTIALVKLRDGPVYWYVLSSVLLVFFATVPYTGWILGYFVSARLISRASWFSPLGLAGVLVLESIIEFLRTRGAFRNEEQMGPVRRNGIFLGLLLCCIFVSPFLGFVIVPRVPLYFERLSHNKQLSDIGGYIDRNTSTPVTVIALDYRDVQLLPAISAHSTLISFREELDYNGHNNFLSIEEIHRRIYASNTIRSLDENVWSLEKCSLVKEYEVKYVLAQTKDIKLFETTVDPCDLKVDVVYRTKELSLLEIW